MIRLRQKSGETAPLDPAPFFIELLDADGAVALVMWQMADGAIKLSPAGSEDLLRYCRMFNLTPSKRVVRLPL